MGGRRTNIDLPLNKKGIDSTLEIYLNHAAHQKVVAFVNEVVRERRVADYDNKH